MKKEDYQFLFDKEECNLDVRLRLTSENEFIKNCKQIRDIYLKLPMIEKRIYKLYVYSQKQFTENFQNAIWEYLHFDLQKDRLKYRKHARK